jgi:hypothetical protein
LNPVDIGDTTPPKYFQPGFSRVHNNLHANGSDKAPAVSQSTTDDDDDDPKSRLGIFIFLKQNSGTK